MTIISRFIHKSSVLKNYAFSRNYPPKTKLPTTEPPATEPPTAEPLTTESRTTQSLTTLIEITAYASLSSCIILIQLFENKLILFLSLFKFIHFLVKFEKLISIVQDFMKIYLNVDVTKHGLVIILVGDLTCWKYF